MKTVLLIFLANVAAFSSFAQDSTIKPSNNPFDSKRIKNESYKMVWYIKQDTSKIEIGKINTEIKKAKDNVIVITTIDMAKGQTKWVDSTIAKINNLKPIYHSSFNMQRDMVLHFDKKVTGYYLDKKTNVKSDINVETATNDYFDSNIYPQLIRWLPLKEGYQEDISIFDYNPKAKTGVIKAFLKNVRKDVFKWKNNKSRNVWVVETTDDISDKQVLVTFYIDIETGRLWKQEIDMQGRKMVMEYME